MVWHVIKYDVISSIYPSSLIHPPIQSAFLSSQLISIKISTNFFKKADKALAHRVLTELIQSSLSDDYSSSCHRFDLDHQELSELVRKGRRRMTYSSQPQQNQSLLDWQTCNGAIFGTKSSSDTFSVVLISAINHLANLGTILHSLWMLTATSFTYISTM